MLLLLIWQNSVFIVDWLNKSMFVDYKINSISQESSFYNGVSLIFLIFIFSYSIIGTYLVSLIAVNTFFIVFIFANGIKIKERNEFITFSDFKMLNAPRELLSFINMSMVSAILLILGTIVILVILQLLILRFSRKLKFRINKWVRIFMFTISSILLLGIFWKPDYYNTEILKYQEPHTYNVFPLKLAQEDGYLPSFMHTVKPEYINKPELYSNSKMKEIAKKYNKISKVINKSRSKNIKDTQTIIYLSESLIDTDRVPNLLLNETPTPFISKTSKENLGGTIYSQYMGGGTANIEWSVLTSFSSEVLLEPITAIPYLHFYNYSKNHNTILSLYDNKKVAIHPYTDHIYRRSPIYNQIGFDDYLYLDNGIKNTKSLEGDTYVSDSSLNKEILRVAKQRDVGLIQAISMQNHYPFNSKVPNLRYIPEINPNIYPKEKEEYLINYLKKIKETDRAIEDLIRELDDSNKEYNLLLFGDHFPNLFSGEESKYKDNTLHETPWFIYMSNNRSKMEIELEGLSPAFLIPVLLEEGDYKVTAFQGLLYSLLEADVKRVGGDFIVTYDGKLKDKDIPRDLLKMVKDYRLIQHDALFGDDYLGDDFYRDIK